MSTFSPTIHQNCGQKEKKMVWKKREVCERKKTASYIDKIYMLAGRKIRMGDFVGRKQGQSSLTFLCVCSKRKWEKDDILHAGLPLFFVGKVGRPRLFSSTEMYVFLSLEEQKGFEIEREKSWSVHFLFHNVIVGFVASTFSHLSSSSFFSVWYVTFKLFLWVLLHFRYTFLSFKGPFTLLGKRSASCNEAFRTIELEKMSSYTFSKDPWKVRHLAPKFLHTSLLIESPASIHYWIPKIIYILLIFM